jgi:hypothetical protein
MTQKSKRLLKPEEVAEQSKKGWKSVTIPPADMSPGDAPDAVAPELDIMKKRYSLTEAEGKGLKKKIAAKKPVNTHMVVIQPPDDADTRVGRKVVVVEDGEKIGEQG